MERAAKEVRSRDAAITEREASLSERESTVAEREAAAAESQQALKGAQAELEKQTFAVSARHADAAKLEVGCTTVSHFSGAQNVLFCSVRCLKLSVA